MKVYVIMGNDFPDCVFSNEEEAQEYCRTMAAKNLEEMNRAIYSRRIYYKSYPFELKGKKE